MAVRYVPVTKVAVHQTYDGTFECAHCGLEAPATVGVKAYGRATGHGSYAAEQARDSAGEDGSTLASRTLQFANCPKCGMRSDGAASYRISVTLGSLAIGAIIGAVIMLGMTGHVIPARDSQGTPAAIGYGLGALFTIGLYWMWGRAWRGVKERVQIDMSRAVVHARED